MNSETETFIVSTITEQGYVTPGQISEHIKLSRQQIHRITTRLIHEGKIVKLGATRNLRFVAPITELQSTIGARPLSFSRRLELKNLDESIIFREQTQRTNVFELLPINVLDIVRFGFTEMLNNVIDHSGAQNVTIEGSRTTQSLQIEIRDNGIGLLENFRQHFNLIDEREALLEVVKGKLTTRTDKHSGQGLFFTSRAVDIFVLESGALRLIRNNLLKDTFIESKRQSRGTAVKFTLATNATRTLREVFDEFSSVDEGFFGTDYFVKLIDADDAFISRPQAKMIMHGLERFKQVTLDFARVRVVGQGFADEIFRVWKADHAGTTIIWTNANPDVEFMLKRALRT